MKIITKVYKAVGKYGSYEIRVVRIAGVKARELVKVRARKSK